MNKLLMMIKVFALTAVLAMFGGKCGAVGVGVLSGLGMAYIMLNSVVECLNCNAGY